MSGSGGSPLAWMAAAAAEGSSPRAQCVMTDFQSYSQAGPERHKSRSAACGTAISDRFRLPAACRNKTDSVANTTT